MIHIDILVLYREIPEYMNRQERGESYNLEKDDGAG